MQTIKEFQNEYRFLSNFHFVNVVMDGEVYRTTEHAYQAAKTIDKDQRKVIRNAERPSETRKLGQKVTLRSDWESVKISIMTDLQRQKYQNPQLRQQLIDTHPNHLEEGNRWGDKFWGIDLRTGEGQNHLGKILMKIRDELIAQSNTKVEEKK